MMSTSVGSELSLPRSPMDDITPTSCLLPPKSSSPSVSNVIIRGSNQRMEDCSVESPTKSRRMSFKEKFKKFTSPTMSRKHNVNSEQNSKMIDSGVGIDS